MDHEATKETVEVTEKSATNPIVKGSTKGNKKTFIIIGVIVGVILICCCVSILVAGRNLPTVDTVSPSPTDKVLENATTTEIPSATATTKPVATIKQLPKIGDVVTVGNAQWTLVAARDIGSTLKSSFGAYGKDCVANSGKFIQVDLKIKNLNKDVATVTNPDLIDSLDRSFVTSSDVYSCVDTSLFLLSSVNPGIEKSFSAIYEVPLDASGFKLEVGDFGLFNLTADKLITLGF
jgi:hypothetical protein